VFLRDRPARDYGVVVSNGVFREVGPTTELLQRHSHLVPVRLAGKLLMPGFIDAHHHLTQSFGKSLVFGEPSEIFRRVWVPMEQRLDDHTAYFAAKLAALESLRGGFTTVCDAGTRASIDLSCVAAATKEAGLRCVLGLVCNDRSTAPEEEDPSRVMRRAEAHLTRWEHDALIHPSLAVSVPEAATDRTLQNASALAAEAGRILQIHVNEHLVAVERSLENLGVRPLEHLHRVGALGPQILAAHATLVTPTELCILRDTNTAVSYNPVASAWKGNAVAPATMMAALGIRFGLGTDGTRGDGFRLVDAAEFAQRLVFGLQVGDSSCGAGWTWLDHALADGAQAVGLGASTGEIVAGKAADFLIVDLDVPEMLPSWDPSWELVRLANRDQIVAVFVGGRLRLWRGWPIDWDGHALLEEITKIAHAVVERAPIQRIHPTSTEHRRRMAESAASATSARESWMGSDHPQRGASSPTPAGPAAARGEEREEARASRDV
jgi:cytosine/adenosine deaminase-related metal-dependent hydrolase